jgi:hypothetical protein
VQKASLTTHRYNPDPRLSANQIAEYLEAPAPRRQAILRDAKYPPTFILIRYEDAVAPVVGYFTGKEEALENGILRLKRKELSDGLTDFLRENCRLCVDALESFRSTINNLDTRNTVFKPCDLHDTKLRIKDVRISVSLQVLTEEVGRGGKRSMGAAILSFTKSKSPKEMEARCKAVSVIIYRYLKTHPRYSSLCSPHLCMAIDVPNAKIYRAGAAQQRFWKTVEASCAEVKAIWPAIEPPANYNGPLPRVA